MVQLWYMNNNEDDQRLEHHLQPPRFCDLTHLKEQTNVLYWKLNPKTASTDGSLASMKAERGYSYEDVCEISPDKMPNYEQKIKIFYEEHIHTDEEIRFILDGSGYFDVRDKEENWIRIKVEAGDLLVLPAGIYHRFTLDTKNYVKAMRLFVGEPVWTPHPRPAEHMKERQEYITAQKHDFYPEPIQNSA